MTDDFFVGIGDINSAFLPKLEPLVPVAPPPPPPVIADSTTVTEELEAEVELDGDEEDDDEDDLEDVMASSDGASSPGEDERLAEIEKNEILSRNTQALEAQVEERPLAKKQEELQETVNGEAASPEQPTTGAVPATNGSDASAEQQPKRERHVRKALLKNDDTELQRVKQVRRRVCSPRICLTGYCRSSSSCMSVSTPLGRSANRRTSRRRANGSTGSGRKHRSSTTSGCVSPAAA